MAKQFQFTPILDVRQSEREQERVRWNEMSPFLFCNNFRLLWVYAYANFRFKYRSVNAPSQVVLNILLEAYSVHTPIYL